MNVLYVAKAILTTDSLEVTTKAGILARVNHTIKKLPLGKEEGSKD